jgi:biotin carboxyl carrier protein
VTTLIDRLDGEHLAVRERLVLAPVAGRFAPLPSKTVTAEGEVVWPGQVIGTVENSGTRWPVENRFAGFLMGMLAHPGERVREGQPVAWLRVFEA